jgi:cytidine deaminase
MLEIKNSKFDVTQVLDFHGRPLGSVFFGVELELEIEGASFHKHYCCESCHGSREAWDKGQENLFNAINYTENTFKDFIVLKEDASIKKGFEIVTAPASLSVHQNRWRKFFQDIPTNFNAPPNCGLHVHISKKPLTKNQWWGIHQFVNMPKNSDFITFIAGRGSVDYCQRRTKPEEVLIAEHEGGSKKYPYRTKYSAVNLLSPDTLEVRIFASTTLYQTFMERLEFVAALTHWIQKGEWSPTTLCEENLKEFTQTHQKLYPMFWAWLEKEGK